MKARKTLTCIVLPFTLILSLAACGAKQEQSAQQSGQENTSESAATEVTYENGGVKLLVPAQYDSLVSADTPHNDPNGVIFSVTELASYEAAAKQGLDLDNAGWLFDIRLVDEDTLHEMLCYDMSGERVFACDAAGNYYLFCHPTDVTYVRENNAGLGDEGSADWQQWTSLHEWMDTVCREFLINNQGTVEPFERTNSMLDMYLSRAAYQDGVNYTLSTTEFGPMEPNGVDAKPYAELLMGGNDVSYEEVDLSETPDGEYVVLYFPDDDVRFDFFKLEGKENYVRTVWNGDNEELMRAYFADDSRTASGIAQDWYNELVAVNGGQSRGADALLGVWAESIAGRGVIEITRGAGDTYDVQINWGNGAAENYVWRMTATATGDNEISYENGEHVIVTFTSETESSEAVQYTNGAGKLWLNDNGELVWQDDTGHAGDDCVFVNAG